VAIEVIGAIGGGQRRTQLFRSSNDSVDLRFQMQIASGGIGEHLWGRLREVDIHLGFSVVAGDDGGVGEDGVVQNLGAGRVPGQNRCIDMGDAA
jgi:hypothetical protein